MTQNPTSISDESKLSVAVMGTGNWGRNLVRVFNQLDGVKLNWIVDPDERALTTAHLLAPHANRAGHISSAVSHVDLVAVCTPARHHYAHVKSLLQHKKHVLVEKPFAMDTDDAVALAKMASGTLMVGHQLLFHPAFTSLKDVVIRGTLGRLLHVKTERTGKIDLTQEPGVLWSYGPHDVSMVLALTGREPAEICASGVFAASAAEALVEAQILLDFATGVRAEIFLSTTATKRTRRLTAVCERGTLIFDDSEPGGRLVVLDGPPDSLSSHDITIARAEPLALECTHFVDCIRRKKVPLTGAAHAVLVTRILETVANRIRVGEGKPISYTCSSAP